jgi:hypothetical protein
MLKCPNVEKLQMTSKRNEKSLIVAETLPLS